MIIYVGMCVRVCHVFARVCACDCMCERLFKFFCVTTSDHPLELQSVDARVSMTVNPLKQLLFEKFP